MMIRLSLIIVLFFVGFCTHSLTLEEYLQRFDTPQKSKVENNAVSEDLPTLINPLDDFEYTYERKYLDQPNGSDGTDIFTINFKSFNELKHTYRARGLTRKLLQQTKGLQDSGTQLIQTLTAIRQILSERKKDLAKAQKPFLDSYISQQKTLAAADGTTLRRILDLQMQLEMLEVAQNSDSAKSNAEERIELIKSLIAGTSRVISNFEQLNQKSQHLELERTELELDKVEDAINSDSGFNGITHFEVRQDRKNNLETEYRVGLSFPLDFNTDEDHRKRAFRAYRQTQLNIREQEAEQEYQVALSALNVATRQISVLNSQVERLKVLKSRKGRSSGKLASSARLILFETQMTLLDKLDDFYSTYLSVLSEHVVISKGSNPLSDDFINGGGK